MGWAETVPDYFAVLQSLRLGLIRWPEPFVIAAIPQPCSLPREFEDFSFVPHDVRGTLRWFSYKISFESQEWYSQHNFAEVSRESGAHCIAWCVNAGCSDLDCRNYLVARNCSRSAQQ